jgi:hypothetical protein
LSGSSRILDVVTGMGVVPAWVVPPAVEVEDLFWAARALRKDPASARITARGAAVAWVCGGGGAAPVTGRTETPVTWGLASAEMWAALVVCARSSPPPPSADVCAGWGVHYVPPWVSVGRDVGDGVARVLGWLLGAQGCSERPMLLPRRNATGRVLTAEELYADAVAQAPDRYRLREQQVELWDRAQHEAGFSAALADLIEVTKRRAAAA